MIPASPDVPQHAKHSATRLSHLLSSDVASGLIVLIAALAGFALANSSLSGEYFSIRELRFGPETLHLHLSLGDWAADGLLAVFFFVVGLELKREFTSGTLSSLKRAMVPVLAACGGAVVPAAIYVALNFSGTGSSGWAIPTATDIAFAVAVLALVAPGIPPALRTFLLTLAVVDDLIAITIIAIFYSSGIQLIPLLAALCALALFGWLLHKWPEFFLRSQWLGFVILVPLALTTWALVHAAGVHATVAGVLLACMVPVRARNRSGTRLDLTKTFQQRFTHFSSWVAVPVFAFFAAGVSVKSVEGFPFDPVPFGILLALIFGKPIGIVLSTLAISRFTGAQLPGNATMREMIGVGCLGGIGFTVSLLITDLSFSTGNQADLARLAVMTASLVSALLAALFLAKTRRPSRTADTTVNVDAP